ncbi:MAG TPA: hypothetical protein VN633_24725 [Bryobacteraceae bacterium]|nr:hypothetical protein [Bryobacteraceae bacterium]
MLLRIGIRTIEHLRLSIRDAHHRAGGGGRTPLLCFQEARVGHSFHEGFAGAKPMLLLGSGQLRPTGLIHIVHENVFHSNISITV